ncbi:zinc finger BED domain-containing protein 1-like, partial [Aphis craccivora]
YAISRTFLQNCRILGKAQDTVVSIKEVALKYASIPATSVPSERIFSKTGQIISARRNRLLPENLDTLKRKFIRIIVQ